jgi:type III secretion protein L
MVIWLRNPYVDGAGVHGIGVAGDVLRGVQLASVVEIDAGYEEMRRRCDAALEAAHVEAAGIVAAARVEADACLAAARDDYTSAARRGHDDGSRQALADWHARSRQTGAGSLALHTKLRERLAQLVVLAVERIVSAADPATLYAEALANVDRIVADGSPVRIRVHPDDLAAASAEFARAAQTWGDGGRTVRLQVSADATLAPGSCLCETDLGAVDASLSLQLAAMRDAVERAVQGMAGADESVADFHKRAGAHTGADPLADPYTDQQPDADQHASSCAELEPPAFGEAFEERDHA